jgi:hypothetical protein
MLSDEVEISDSLNLLFHSRWPSTMFRQAAASSILGDSAPVELRFAES